MLGLVFKVGKGRIYIVGKIWASLDVQTPRSVAPAGLFPPGRRALARRRSSPWIFGSWWRARTFWTAGFVPPHVIAEIWRVWNVIGRPKTRWKWAWSLHFHGSWWTWMGGQTSSWEAQNGPIMTGRKWASDMGWNIPETPPEYGQKSSEKSSGHAGQNRGGSGSRGSWSTRLELEDDDVSVASCWRAWHPKTTSFHLLTWRADADFSGELQLGPLNVLLFTESSIKSRIFAL